jgi:NitT/TauT family transport system substrate-binding protein
MSRLSRLAVLAAFGIVAAFAALPAAAQTKIRFTLDWIPQSTHGPFLIALYEGYYKDEGLDVTFDPGKGSADAVRRIVSGAYDMGFPDINALIEYNAKNPDKQIPVVLMGYEQAPMSIFVMKKSGITDPRQLVGKTLGAPVFDASYQLFPAFAKAVGIDPASVKRKNMDPQLREPMLVRGDVDAISGHLFSSMLQLKGLRVKEEDVRYFLYKDYGTDFYGNGIAVSPTLLRQNPDVVKAFLRATIKATREMVQTPKKAVDAVLRFEPLLKRELEVDRLRLGMACCILTPNVKKDGYGGVDMARLARSIEEVALARKLERRPTAQEMFDASFLPPKEQRLIHE